MLLNFALTFTFTRYALEQFNGKGKREGYSCLPNRSRTIYPQTVYKTVIVTRSPPPGGTRRNAHRLIRKLSAFRGGGESGVAFRPTPLRKANPRFAVSGQYKLLPYLATISELYAVFGITGRAV